MSVFISKEKFPEKYGLIRVLKIPVGTLISISYDGTLFVSTNDNTVQIWDLKEGKKLQEFIFPENDYVSCDISFNNRYIACVSPNWLCLWELKSGELLWNLKSKSFWNENNYYVKFSPDNKYLICAGDIITVRDLKTKKKIWSCENPTGTVNSLTISRDGKYILTPYYLWDLNSGKKLQEFIINEKDEYYEPESGAVAISHDNKYIAGTFGLGTTIVWNFKGNIIYKLRKWIDPEIVNYSVGDLDVEFSPNGKYIASVSFYRRSIDVWDINTRKIVNRIEHESEIYHMKFLPSGNYIIFGDKNGFIFIQLFLRDPEIKNLLEFYSQGINFIRNKLKYQKYNELLRDFNEVLELFQKERKSPIGLIRVVLKGVVKNIVHDLKGIDKNMRQSLEFLEKKSILNLTPGNREKHLEVNSLYNIFSLLSHYASHPNPFDNEMCSNLCIQAISWINLLLSRLDQLDFSK